MCQYNHEPSITLLTGMKYKKVKGGFLVYKRHFDRGQEEKKKYIRERRSRRMRGFVKFYTYTKTRHKTGMSESLHNLSLTFTLSMRDGVEIKHSAAAGALNRKN